MPYARSKDGNHDDRVADFKDFLCIVLDLHHIGRGMPDLFVRAFGLWHPVEIKRPDTAYGRRGLNKIQMKWNEAAVGDVRIVRTRADVKALVNEWAIAATGRALR